MAGVPQRRAGPCRRPRRDGLAPALRPRAAREEPRRRWRIVRAVRGRFDAWIIHLMRRRRKGLRDLDPSADRKRRSLRDTRTTRRPDATGSTDNLSPTVLRTESRLL